MRNRFIHTYMTIVMSCFAKNRNVFFLLLMILSSMWMVACHRATPTNCSVAQRETIDSLIFTCPSMDSLTLWLDHYQHTKNKLGIILACKELGKRYRETARFDEAINYHRKGLMYAVQMQDTVEMIQALNNLGTNFRRLGIMDEASTYHYQALILSEHYGNKSTFIAKKNRVISLSGIGNVYLTLENLDAADSIFRVTLEGERELRSDLGQAMNYANLGSVFEAKEMIDSALVYYQLSMKHNRLARSDLGISLCHNHFGRLFARKGKWDDALREYRNAYDLMEKSGDDWHWLEACLSLARVSISKGDIRIAERYLDKAQRTADAIHAWEHLCEVYRLKYICYEKEGDCRRALDSYIQSRAYADSVKNVENVNHIQNLRVNYERERNTREMTLLRGTYEMQQRTKNIYLLVSLLALLLVGAAAGLLWYVSRMKSRHNRAMKKMEKVRSSFFTNVTHEFRTPLTVILGLLEQLQKGDVSKEELKKNLETISRQGQSLLDLVNQLLEVSKVSSEVGEPDWRTGDIVAYTRMIVENYQIYARQKQIDLRFVPAETSVEMDFVPKYLSKIVCNLLSNAFKFTSKGGQVTLLMSRSKDKLIINVADTGTGIAAGDLPHIFDTFYQGENNTKANIGSGIGLSLVKQMAECMDGSVKVTSMQGHGTKFTVTLPLQHGSSLWEKYQPDKKMNVSRTLPVNSDDVATTVGDEAEQISEGGKVNELAQVTILIVEDNEDISYYIGGLLKKNYHLLYARNGKEGVEKAKEYIPDLILTDLMMPEMDGYELCCEIRRSDILNHIPIIIITAKSEEEDRVHGLEIGADAFLQKPFNANELNVRITKLLEQRRLLREKYSHVLHEGVGQVVELSAVDQEFLTRLNDLIYSLMGRHNLSSDMLADKMCMSLSQLNRKVKAITGFSSSGYILQMRMDRAKRMLASTNTSIGDIAMKCGFPEMSYFSRMFKQTFQMTPSQYRKKIL